MLIRGVQEDTYSYGLMAQPGGYVGRAVTTPGSWPIGQLARPLSPDQPTNPGSGGRILPPKPARHLHHASYDVVLRLAEECSTVPVRVIRLESNSGPAVARNTAIEAATTEFLGILDSDDAALPEWLQIAIPLISEDGRLASVGGGAIPVGPEGEPIASFACKDQAGDRTAWARKGHAPFWHSGTLWRSTTFARLGGYDARMRAAQDLDLQVRFAWHGGQMVHVGHPLVKYRIRPGSVGRADQTRQMAVLRYILRKIELLGTGMTNETASAVLAEELEAIEALPRSSSAPGYEAYAIGKYYRIGGHRAKAASCFRQAIREGYPVREVLPRLVLASLPFRTFPAEHWVRTQLMRVRRTLRGRGCADARTGARP